jgi:ribonuclease HI
MATDFFKCLYTEDRGVVAHDLINMLHSPISPEMNLALCREFTDEEIGDALFQIGPIKAPGPDGLPGRFFQRNWAIMKQEVIGAVKDFFRSGKMAEGVNDTVIVLIPKGPNPESLADYRSISLCNVVYKIISKCLVNRLRPILDSIISETQSAFVPGRLITDNAIIAFEGFHKIQHHNNQNSSHCAYKLDLSKAYDRVDWNFLEKAMMKMGFCTTWTNWIMACVRSVRFSVRINGSTLDTFTPSRGLRQGDPLSPYLFLLVGEALTCILKNEVTKGSITPLKVARRAPGISHLLFADDCLLFFKATKEEAQAVNNALNLFQRCTGQLLSVNKCSVLFSQVCPTEAQEEVKTALKVTSYTFEEKYLGLPTPDGRMKGEHFQPIMDRFTKRLTNWAEKFMSHGAKDILIKAVAQALPGFVMGVFKMSAGFCDQFERLIRDFWWGDEQGQRKVHWLAWENMIKPKGKGGIGFRDISLFNQALLARQAWRLIQRPNSLCARVLKAKYYPNGNILDTVFATDPSPVWRGVEFGLELLKKGIIKRIGNGKNTQFSRDNWLPRDSGLKIAGLKKNSRRRWVNQLILPNSNSWNTSLLRELFYDFDVDTILKIKLPGYEVEDCVAWHYENNGCFTVKSAYRLAMSLKQQNRGNESSSSQLNGDRPIWKTIWKASVPPKVRVFGWRVATNSLAMKENKCRRTLEVNNICSVCGNGTEDAHHATVSCTKAKALRHALREVWDLPGEKKFSCTGNDWLQVLLSHEDERMRARILLLLWRSWHLRNDVIHHEGKETVTSSVAFLLSYQRDTNQTNPYIGDTKGKCELNPNKKGSLQLNENPKTWNAPPVGWIKLNTDGSLPTNSNVGGAGAVARDSMGRVIFAACAPLPDCTDIEEAEARAAMLGLSILSRQGPVRVILEMDNTTTVSALRSESQDRSRLWTVYQEAKRMLLNMEECIVRHSKRETNKVADSLAKLAKSLGEKEMRDDLPISVRELVIHDSNYCNLG